MVLSEKSGSPLHDFLQDEFYLIDHWYRFEWHNRGSGHVHGFLWLKDTPSISQITDASKRQKNIDYFGRLVCMENQDASTSMLM